MTSNVVVADMTLLYKLLTCRNRRAVFSGRSLRIETRRGTVLAELALESVQELTIRRGWFASTLTVQPVQGARFKVAGLNEIHALHLRDAVFTAATERAAAIAPELIAADESLCRLWQRGCYVRHGEMLAVHDKLVSAVQQCGGLINEHLPAPASDALERLEELEPAESIEAVRWDVNQRFVSTQRRSVVAAAETAVGAHVTDEQAEAVATDEKVTLVLAGAGTGKTTVIAAKVAHLVRNEGVDPKQILVLAFNKKAQIEIHGRLTGELSAVDVATFHAFGRGVVADCEQTQPSVSKIATDGHIMRTAIDEFLNELIASEEASDLVTSYLNYHLEPCLSPFDFDTDADYDDYWRNVELRTLSGDQVKSIQELQIANYLSEHGINFEYEPKYEHQTDTHDRRQYYPDFLLCDHGIYIEHFALNEHGDPPPHWNGYAEGVVWKRQTHQRHGTSLIETYSWEHQRGTWRESLREKLEAHRVVLTPIPRQELLRMLSETKISRLSDLLAAFLNHVKTSSTDFEVLRARARVRSDVSRALTFLDIFTLIQQHYEQHLEAADELDFHDFINRAARLIGDREWTSRYRYVLVDEFQDISAGRMALLRALNNTDVGYFLVGDDWQSIYRFAGSDVSLITDVGDHLGFVQQRNLSLTFRYGDGILVPSSAFIKANPQQTQRPLRSNNTARDDGITVVAADDTRSGVQEALRDIERIAGDEDPEVVVLGRYTYSNEAVPSGVKFNTVHAAKGTQADYVIVVDLADRQHGFPSQITDDTLLELVLPPQDGNTHAFAEERRLFYVALTRARHGTYLVTDRKFPSIFVLELLQHHDGLRQIGDLEPTPPCPRCSNGHLVRSSTNKTLRCINYPRCSHMAPLCRSCSNGYVVITPSDLAVCTNPACNKPYDICPSCGQGVIVPRQSPKAGPFEACTEHFTKLECTYTRNIPRTR